MADPTADNILQQVITYQEGGLAFLQNSFGVIAKSNKKFEGFNKIGTNLGSTVSFDLPYRFESANSLVASFQPIKQRVQTLTVTEAKNVAVAYSSEQFIFDLERYMNPIGKGAIKELGTDIEANVALNFSSNTFRFFGDGITPLNTYQQLAQAVAQFREFGCAKSDITAFIPNLAVPAIIGNGLSQFATNRNNEIANSWELGSFSDCDWYSSNLLPLHTAGSEGANNTTLTVVSVTTNALNQITAITFSGTNAANDANSIKKYDKLQFRDGVANQPNLRYLTFVGHKPSGCSVQVMATADAGSTAGSQVTVSIYPPLQAAVGAEQNINNQIVAGMQVNVLPSHRCGVIMGGNPLFLAMPKLPDQNPFATSNVTDDDSGANLRMYWGTRFGENQQGLVHDVIWGSTMVPEYALMLVFPE